MRHPDTPARRGTPAWRRPTRGEPRWPVGVAVLVVVVLQVVMPDAAVPGPRWLLPLVEAALLTVLVATRRPYEDEPPSRRVLSLALTGVVAAGNAASIVLLVASLVAGRGGDDPGTLLATGGAVWVVNVVTFALLFWQFDRGGPAARAQNLREPLDLVFPQMQSPELAPPEWEPRFADYLYVAFTNATAFSPTDTMPFSRWAKATMAVQSAVSLVTVALVVARAVNVLR